jgi:effector-binding domain-containing protein
VTIGKGPSVRHLEETTVASMRRRIPIEQLGAVMAELAEACRERGIAAAGPPMAIYYDTEFDPRDTDVEVCVPVTAEFASDEKVRRRTLPGGAVATIIHRGGYDTIGESYAALMAFVQEQGHRVIGPPREVYLVGPGAPGGTESFQTEIQVPVLSVH